MEQVLEGVKSAWGNFQYFYLFLALLLVSLIFLKGYRKSFIIPLVIITIAVLNPLFYKIWNDYVGYAYFRALWMIPVILVCAAVPAYFVGKSKWKWLQLCVAVIAAGSFILLGHFVYDTFNTGFIREQNADKIPDDAVRIADALLEMDDEPYVVTTGDFSVYLRTYSGRIHEPYAREVVDGNPTGIAKDLNNQLLSMNYEGAFQTMVDNGYEYLVVYNKDETNKQAIEEAGFTFAKQVGSYGIYKAAGSFSIVRTYNDRHRITSETTIDTEGNPVNNEDGYATVLYDYDDWNRLNYRFYLDADGEAVPDASGRAGFRWLLDYYGNVLVETRLGTDGEPLEEGYTYRKCEYNQYHKVVGESYYDLAWNPVNTNEGYASCDIRYTDGRYNELRYYFDKEGNQLQLGSGNLHEYLQSLKGRDLIIFISAKDEASSNLVEALIADMHDLGIVTDLRGKRRCSFYAVVSPEGVLEAASEEPLQCEGSIDDLFYSIQSAGYLVGNYSSIVINGKEYSKNMRGLNIVVVENGEVIDSVSFDTYSPTMKMTR